MAKQYNQLQNEQAAWIGEQKIFFVGTAAQDGRVNISPKGLDTLRVIDHQRIVWLNLTGSGNETAAHLLRNDRITLMFCAFDGKPLILRVYGTATFHHENDSTYHEYIDLFKPTHGARQIVIVNIEMVQTSCGYAVPLMEYQSDRSILDDWAKKQGRDKIKSYWKEKNTQSIDGFDTDIK